MRTFVALLTLITVSFTACQKESELKLEVYLTDAPLAVDEVNIDLKEVQVKLDDSTSWHKLQTTAGRYNLLALQNGTTAMIAAGTFSSTVNVKEIRLVLGSNNDVVSNGQTHPLTIPSGSESGLKIKIDKKLRNTLDKVVIDFDAALSVKQEQDGYKLRPVLRVK